MNPAREDILRKVLSAAGAQPSQSIERRYIQQGALSRQQRCHLFTERLAEYGSVVHHCSEQGIAQTVHDVLTARRKHALIFPEAFNRSWLPPSFDFRTDDALSYAQLDACDGVITGCVLAIASTGTIVLRHSSGEGRRALTLIPDYHLCIVGSHQLVETVVESVRAMAHFGMAPMTTISGPSATSDIEMTRIKGVHGPRTLDVILWDSTEVL